MDASRRVSGTCHVLVAADIGFEIDLERAAARLDGTRQDTFRHRRGVRAERGDQRWPVRTRRELGATTLDGETPESLEVSVFGFGAVCLDYALPFSGTLEDLAQRSARLSEGVALRADARARVTDLLARMGDAVREPGVEHPFESYTAFALDPAPEDARPEDLIETQRATLARILRAEKGELSEEEIVIALQGRAAYRPRERVVVDGTGALLLGRDLDDELRVLELALVERVELRFLDDRLGRRIDEAYGLLARGRGPLFGLSPRSREVERLARFQADSAVLHESSDNALKLLGDDYLARLYELCSDRFAFPAWDRSIERKLATLESVYTKISDAAARRRAELLEWIIILLFVIDIGLLLLGDRGGHA